MNTEKQIIRIQLDYLQGPIWISDVETGEPLTGIDLVDNDPVLKELNFQAARLFDSHDQPCWFNHEKEKAEKEVMLNLIARIVLRLKELNDGSLVIEDFETERLKAL